MSESQYWSCDGKCTLAPIIPEHIHYGDNDYFIIPLAKRHVADAGDLLNDEDLQVIREIGDIFKKAALEPRSSADVSGDIDALARRAFDRYREVLNAERANVRVTWDQLPDTMQAAWLAAVEVILNSQRSSA